MRATGRSKDSSYTPIAQDCTRVNLPCQTVVLPDRRNLRSSRGGPRPEKNRDFALAGISSRSLVPKSQSQKYAAGLGRFGLALEFPCFKWSGCAYRCKRFGPAGLSAGSNTAAQLCTNLLRVERTRRSLRRYARLKPCCFVVFPAILMVLGFHRLVAGLFSRAPRK
jgi:hypothetical protein